MGSESKLIISPLNNDLIEDINMTNDYFKLYGRVVPSLQSGRWSYKEVLFDETRKTRFPDDKLDWSQYINREDKALFLAYMNNTCIGQIRIIKDWNHFCYSILSPLIRKYSMRKEPFLKINPLFIKNEKKMLRVLNEASFSSAAMNAYLLF